jgi:hypothetical protein
MNRWIAAFIIFAAIRAQAGEDHRSNMETESLCSDSWYRFIDDSVTTSDNQRHGPYVGSGGSGAKYQDRNETFWDIKVRRQSHGDTAHRERAAEKHPEVLDEQLAHPKMIGTRLNHVHCSQRNNTISYFSSYWVMDIGEILIKACQNADLSIPPKKHLRLLCFLANICGLGSVLGTPSYRDRRRSSKIMITNLDGSVKSPISALRFILRHCGVL